MTIRSFLIGGGSPIRSRRRSHPGRLPRYATPFASWALTRLVRRARSDDRAFETLFRRFASRLRFHSARYRIPGWTSDDAFQIASLGFWQAVQTFDPHRHLPFAPWADRLVAARLADAARMALRHKHRPLNTAVSWDTILSPAASSDPLRLADVLADPSPTPDDVLVSQDVWRYRILMSARHLTAVEWTVFTLRAAGDSYAAIGQKTGLSPKQVDNTLHRARQKLRITLSDRQNS